MPPEKQPVPLLGRLAVHLKMISMEQLTEALRVQGQGGGERSLGIVLRELGYLNPAQIEKLVEAQKRVLAQQQQKGGAPNGSAASAAKPAAAPTRPEPVKPAPPPAARASAAPAPADSRNASKAAPAARPSTSLDAILRAAVERGASDVHLHSGAPMRLRIAGTFQLLEGASLDPSAIESMLLGALDEKSRAELEDRGQIDLCHDVEGLGRFRANLYRQQRGLDGVFRVIPPRPPTLDELGLPRAVAKLTSFHQGMVLVTGPTGCGKTSTLAALVDLINEERREHVLTVEDPIEFVHPAKRCLVNQRSVKHHTESFARALRAALREDPDVIVIGELRDLETISLALTAAETGHLVLATLHTDNSIRTINRLIGSYPSDAQGQIRTMLSESLRAVISQRLIPRADGKGRVAAIETLVVNKAVGNLIRENKTFQIQSILQTGAAHGMALLDASIRQHVQSGAIAREEALRHCAEPKNLGA
ncbi:MAG TPA: type IV pilus twitching motility protein PilT [Myxococcota bacterium]|nr:type IV pilus twitching motility protein PilT [Myxococcota bacterium]